MPNSWRSSHKSNRLTRHHSLRTVAYKDKVTLVGDAAHAVVPFYGQGMNAASKIASCSTMPGRIPARSTTHFAEYYKKRKENADALADLAVENFIEMRDKTASKVFRTKKSSITCSKACCRHLSAALHNGHIHAHPIRDRSPPRAPARSNRLRRFDSRGHTGHCDTGRHIPLTLQCHYR